MAEKFVDKIGLQILWSKIKQLMGDKVDKQTGKGLSTNDYSTADKTKLTNIPQPSEIATKTDIQNLDVPDYEVVGQVVVSVSETDGKIDVTRKALPTATTAANGLMSKEDKAKLDGANYTDTENGYVSTVNETDGKILVTHKAFPIAGTTQDGFMSKTDKAKLDGISTSIDDAIKALDVADTAVAGKYVSAVSETDGKIAVTRADFPMASTTEDGFMSKQDKEKLDTMDNEIHYFDLDLFNGNSAKTARQIAKEVKEEGVLRVDGTPYFDAHYEYEYETGGLVKKIHITFLKDNIMHTYVIDNAKAVTQKRYCFDLDDAETGDILKVISNADGDILIQPGEGGSGDIDEAAVNQLIDNKINLLDVTDSATTGQYVTSVSETNGKITVSRAAFPVVSSTANGVITPADKTKLDNSLNLTEVNTAIDNKINALDVSDTAVDGQYVSSVSETNGKIAVTRKAFEKVTTAKDGFMSKEDKAKLDTIEQGAAVQIQSNWNQTNAAALDFIKNKPTLGSAAAMEPADIVDTMTYTQFKAAATSAASKADNAGVELKENKGATNGYAPLEGGKVPIEYLPAYVSEIKEFAEKDLFPTPGDMNYLYFARDEQKTYRWSGTQYTEVPSQLALGTSSNTAFAGNKGQVAYDHAMKKGAEFKATDNGVAMMKFKTNSEGHVILASPVTKADIEALGITGGQDGTTYTGGTGITITGTVIKNSGVTNVKESTVDGKIVATIDGTDKEVPVHGLKSAAYIDTQTVLTNVDTYIPTSKAVSNFVDGKLADYEKKTDIKTYTLDGDVDKVQLKVDGVVQNTVNMRGKASWTAAAGSANEILNKPDIYTKAEINAGFWSKDDGNLSDNNFTDDLKDKLDGIEEGAEKNKNSYGKITVGTTVMSAANAEDGFTLVEGSNVTITADAATKKITIATSGGGQGGSYDDTALKNRIAAVESTVLQKEDKSVVNTKADKSDTYTKTNVDGLLADKADSDDVYTKTQADAKLDLKANSADVYTKTAADAKYALKTDVKEYTMTKSADGKKINLLKGGSVVSTVDDVQGEGDVVTYSVSKTGDKIKLTGSDGSSSTADLDTYEFGLEATQETTTPGSAKLQLKKSGTKVSEQDIVTGLKFNNGTTTTPTNWQSGNVIISKDKIGLAKVENKSATDILGEMTSAQVAAALGFTPEDPSKKGSANGYAELDSTGKVPANQLPAYISEIKQFASRSAFPATGDSSIIYVATDTLVQYRWSGSAYVAISSSGGSGGGVELGETSTTAYRGDRGKTAYDHASETKAGANAVGLYKFSTTANGHIASVVAATNDEITSMVNVATQTAKGAMSAADKVKLDEIAAISDADINAICVL